MERILSLTVPAMKVMEETSPRLLLSFQKTGKGMPQRPFIRVIWPPTAGLAVSDAGAMRTQEDLPSAVNAVRWRDFDLS